MLPNCVDLQNLINELTLLKASGQRPLSFSRMTESGGQALDQTAPSQRMSPQWVKEVEKMTLNNATGLTNLEKRLSSTETTVDNRFTQVQNAFGGNLEALGSLITDKLDNAVTSFNKRFDEFEVVEPDTEEQTVSPIPADAPSTPLDVIRAMTELGAGVLQSYGTQWLKHKEHIPLGLTQDPSIANALEGNTSSAQHTLQTSVQQTSAGKDPPLQTTAIENNAMTQLTAAIAQAIQAQPGRNKDHDKHHGHMKPPEPPRFSKITPETDVMEWLSKVESIFELADYDRSRYAYYAAALFEEQP